MKNVDLSYTQYLLFINDDCVHVDYGKPVIVHIL